MCIKEKTILLSHSIRPATAISSSFVIPGMLVVVCSLLCFVIWDCELILGMAVSVGILGAVVEDASGTLQGGLAFAFAWVAIISSSLVSGWRFPSIQVI